MGPSGRPELPTGTPDAPGVFRRDGSGHQDLRTGNPHHGRRPPGSWTKGSEGLSAVRRSVPPGTANQEDETHHRHLGTKRPRRERQDRRQKRRLFHETDTVLSRPDRRLRGRPQGRELHRQDAVHRLQPPAQGRPGNAGFRFHVQAGATERCRHGVSLHGQPLHEVLLGDGGDLASRLPKDVRGSPEAPGGFGRGQLRLLPIGVQIRYGDARKPLGANQDHCYHRRGCSRVADKGIQQGGNRERCRDHRTCYSRWNQAWLLSNRKYRWYARQHCNVQIISPRFGSLCIAVGRTFERAEQHDFPKQRRSLRGSCHRRRPLPGITISRSYP
mmetsp:Transcript_13656/g.32029  ORF Transcript_13656/g.32029 Transcript_13656/m.32029 type:complete len:329 (-) Transcript_13656:1234-2220(-)